MPPRFAYWTILAGGLPTAFRAADRDDLLPTFRRIQEKHPDAEMKWFARGHLWDSPEDARAQSIRRESRDRSWRPGGDHRDHRDARKAAAQARNQKQRRERFERRQQTRTPAGPAGVKPTAQSAKPSRPAHAPRRPHDRSAPAPPRGRDRPPHKGKGRR